jgi:hypothetical protein
VCVWQNNSSETRKYVTFAGKIREKDRHYRTFFALDTTHDTHTHTTSEASLLHHTTSSQPDGHHVAKHVASSARRIERATKRIRRTE